MHLKDDELVSALGGHADVSALLAATYARVTTAVSFTRMLTPLGNYFIARPAARAAAHHITEETDVPLDAAVVLGGASLAGCVGSVTGGVLGGLILGLINNVIFFAHVPFEWQGLIQGAIILAALSGGVAMARRMR